MLKSRQPSADAKVEPEPLIPDWNPVTPLLDDEWWLCAEIGCSLPNRLNEESTALCVPVLLARSESDPFRLLEFRLLLAQLAPPWPLTLMPDDQLIESIFDLLASFRIHIHARSIVRVGGVAWDDSNADNDDAPAASSASPVRSAPPSDASDFDNGAAQAAALKAAAESGTPFCAVCAAAAKSTNA